jgi:hypothetical protein
MSEAQRADLTTRRSLLSNAATLAGAVALPAGRAGAATSPRPAPLPPRRPPALRQNRRAWSAVPSTTHMQ